MNSFLVYSNKTKCPHFKMSSMNIQIIKIHLLELFILKYQYQTHFLTIQIECCPSPSYFPQNGSVFWTVTFHETLFKFIVGHFLHLTQDWHSWRFPSFFADRDLRHILPVCLRLTFCPIGERGHKFSVWIIIISEESLL